MSSEVQTHGLRRVQDQLVQFILRVVTDESSRAALTPVTAHTSCILLWIAILKPEILHFRAYSKMDKFYYKFELFELQRKKSKTRLKIRNLIQ